MPFVDTNSHLATKPYNFDIKCQSNSESYDQHIFFGTKFRGGQNFYLIWEVFPTRESTLGLTGWTFLYGPTIGFTLNLLPLDFHSLGILGYHSYYATTTKKQDNFLFEIEWLLLEFEGLIYYF